MGVRVPCLIGRLVASKVKKHPTAILFVDISDEITNRARPGDVAHHRGSRTSDALATCSILYG
jgi:hypothetical protein